eukprot:1194762-Prorocentrum_minimum.AAC.4
MRDTYKRDSYSITSFYGSSCANNGKGALNTPELLYNIHTYIWRTRHRRCLPTTRRIATVVYIYTTKGGRGGRTFLIRVRVRAAVPCSVHGLPVNISTKLLRVISRFAVSAPCPLLLVADAFLVMVSREVAFPLSAAFIVMSVRHSRKRLRRGAAVKEDFNRPRRGGVPRTVPQHENKAGLSWDESRERSAVKRVRSCPPPVGRALLVAPVRRRIPCGGGPGETSATARGFRRNIRPLPSPGINRAMAGGARGQRLPEGNAFQGGSVRLSRGGVRGDGRTMSWEGEASCEKAWFTFSRSSSYSMNCVGNIQGAFRELSGNIQGIFREHSGNFQGTFRELSGNIQE